MEDLPSNLEEFWVFDYEGKLSDHKQTVSKHEEVFRLAQEMLHYVNFVFTDTLRRVSSTALIDIVTDDDVEWLVTLDPKRIIVMKKKLEK
jgi:hypothetical protein